jgi:hypothetical protein
MDVSPVLLLWLGSTLMYLIATGRIIAIIQVITNIGKPQATDPNQKTTPAP